MSLSSCLLSYVGGHSFIAVLQSSLRKYARREMALSESVPTLSRNCRIPGERIVMRTISRILALVLGCMAFTGMAFGQSSSSVTLASSLNPSTYGSSVTFTATVSPSAATGTVTFTDGSTTVGNGHDQRRNRELQHIGAGVGSPLDHRVLRRGHKRQQ